MNDSYDIVTNATHIIVAGFAIACLVATVFVQVYKWGQRHPDPTKYCTYQAAIDLATERQQMGYDKGSQGCHAN